MPTQIWHRPPKKTNVLFDLISKVWEPQLPGETSQLLGCLMTQSNTGRQLPSGEVKYVAKQKATIRGWFSCVVIRKLWPKRLREKASWHQRWHPLVPHPSSNLLVSDFHQNNYVQWAPWNATWGHRAPNSTGSTPGRVFSEFVAGKMIELPSCYD